jgi:uncharacterized SAM-binding protein YcdF (DUF218 family)
MPAARCASDRVGPDALAAQSPGFGATPAAACLALNNLFVLLDIVSWKPALSALLLPPVPLLLLLLIGATHLIRRRVLGATLIAFGLAGLWLSHCAGTGQWLSRWLLHPPAALSAERIAELKAQARSGNGLAIVVLGGGAEAFAPEYGKSSLEGASLERLRYGAWLSRATGVPLAFSGGTGWGQAGDVVEAHVAQRIAAEEFGTPLRWIEDRSRDTRENASRSVALLEGSGVRHIIVVTHGWHMRRALRAFEQAAAGKMRIEPAPMGLADDVLSYELAWLPSLSGYTHVRHVLHEAFGLLMGA